MQGPLGDEESGVVAQEVFSKVGLDQNNSKANLKGGEGQNSENKDISKRMFIEIHILKYISRRGR